MVKHVFVRPLRPDDGQDFSKWLFQTKDNAPDQKAILAPSSFTVCAFNKDKKILFAPIQNPMFLESLAVNPEATELEQASAMREVVQYLVSRGYATGQIEIYFLGSHEGTNEFANSQLFERVDLPLYRVKIRDLEPK